MKVSKYISSEVVEIKRSEINPASYNPRKISESAKKLLKANIKRLGVMGGIVWNARTGNLVGGHQKLYILDELHKYNPETKENDYLIRVEKVDLDEKSEKEQNIFLNNKNAQGEFDRDILKELIDDIDYKYAGLEEADLNLLGIELESFKFEEIDEEPEPLELTKPAQKKAEIKEKKEAIKQDNIKRVEEGDTYVMLSFNDHKAKAEFMQRFDLDPMENIIVGEDFADMIERVY